MAIDGSSELVGIIGHEIAYTLSPSIHNEAFRSLDINWIYIPLRVLPGRLEPALAGLSALGFRGANITIPYKVEASRLVDGLRGDAELLEAVNTVVCEGGKILGYNTDAAGFEGLLDESGIEVDGASVLLLGAGGASRSVALALAREGAREIYVMNRTPEKAYALESLLKRATSRSEISIRTFNREGSEVMKSCDVIINTTPLATEEKDDLPIDYELFREGQWAVDLKYSRPKTAFMIEAAARGARTANGEAMLLHQAAASFRLWTAMAPPLEDMRRALAGAAPYDREF